LTGVPRRFSALDVEILDSETLYRGFFDARRITLRHRLFVGRVTRSGAGGIHGLADEHEDLLVHAIPRDRAIAMLDAGDIDNGHTLIALQWLARHGDTLRRQWLS